MSDDESREHIDDLGDETGEEEDPGWPWSFLLLVFAGALYLIFRFYEMAKDLFS